MFLKCRISMSWSSSPMCYVGFSISYRRSYRLVKKRDACLRPAIVALLISSRPKSWMKLLKSFKLVILQLMAFRFLKQVGTMRSYNPVVAVNGDYILHGEGVLSVLDCSFLFFIFFSISLI